jgi:hypothetical protein
MVPEKSRSCSQKPAICPCPKQDESNPCLNIVFVEDQFSCYAPILGREVEKAKENEAARPRFEPGTGFFEINGFILNQ